MLSVKWKDANGNIRTGVAVGFVNSVGSDITFAVIINQQFKFQETPIGELTCINTPVYEELNEMEDVDYYD